MNEKFDLIALIQSSYYKFSKGQKVIAQFIIDHYDKAAFMTASKIGETVDVSESTVVRFASALGYSGFPELQKALQVLIKNKLTTVQRISLDEDIQDTEELHKKVLKNEIDNIRSVALELDNKALDEATKLIFNANRIYILGLRTSFTLANYLGFYLDVMLDNVKVLNNSGINSIFEQLIRIKDNDLLICISFPRYSNKTLNAVKFAKEQNCKILAITDTKESPFYSHSDVSLLAKSNMVSFVDSLVAPMCLLNSLIINIGVNEREDIVRYFDRLEKLWDEYSEYSLYDNQNKKTD